MDTRLYTDKDYVPLNDLKVLGDVFISQITEYRRSFIEMIKLDNLSFVNIVETPSLVKKRYTKNIEIKGKIEIEAENHDYILEIAKEIVKGHDVKGISLSERDELIKQFKDNMNDLTIVTEYLTKNIDKLLVEENESKAIEHTYPGLSKYDVNFINNFNNQSMSYSISDYQKLNDCSYETSRKSLEKLEELKLYEKVKVGKKFVYKPTNNLIKLTGGEK